jgi:RND family efflux transporter MFP subunit
MRGAFILLALSLGAPALAGEQTLTPVEITEFKAVFGRVEPRDQAPARSRIGGVVVRLDVTEGAEVKAGDTIALILDEKLAPQLRAAEARIRALTAERANALTEFERAQSLIARGAGTQQRVDQFRTQVDILGNQIAPGEADRAVVLQQQVEGEVKAPLTGRVLRVPVTKSTVVLPGETVAQIGGGGFFLRLALPERHATALRVGATVVIGERQAQSGRLAKVFPLIENGRVIADIETGGIGTYFVSERVMVQVPIATRMVLAVPRAAIERRAGLDIVRIRAAAGSGSKSATRDIVVVAGSEVPTPDGPRIEILAGLSAGDLVIVP